MFWDSWCYEDLEEKDQSISEIINYGGVCRTAPATPGLLNINTDLTSRVHQGGYGEYKSHFCARSDRFFFNISEVSTMATTLTLIVYSTT